MNIQLFYLLGCMKERLGVSHPTSSRIYGTLLPRRRIIKPVSKFPSFGGVARRAGVGQLHKSITPPKIHGARKNQ